MSQCVTLCCYTDTGLRTGNGTAHSVTQGRLHTLGIGSWGITQQGPHTATVGEHILDSNNTTVHKACKGASC